MPNPQNATVNKNGFRMYRWTDPDTGRDTDVLSVTSIRRLCGEPFNLTTWKVNNVVNVAMGQRKNEKLGPRGGKPKGYVLDGEFPGEFAKRLLAAGGEDAELQRVRKYLTQTADSPRDTAASRGTVVHEAIETRKTAADMTTDYVERAFARDRTYAHPTEADVKFVHDGMVQYESFAAAHPHVILAREPQIWNLTAGYAGSLDLLLWELPDNQRSVDYWQEMADGGSLTLDKIREVGGRIVLGDYKTSADVYTDHVTQVHAYLAGEFVGRDGVKDERLTAILNKTMHGALIHIRPNGWSYDVFEFRQDVLYAFLGSVAYARFLFRFDKPNELFIESDRGNALTEDYEDDSEPEESASLHEDGEETNGA